MMALVEGELEEVYYYARMCRSVKSLRLKGGERGKSATRGLCLVVRTVLVITLTPYRLDFCGEDILELDRLISLHVDMKTVSYVVLQPR